MPLNGNAVLFMEKRRVVITGLGALTPIGNNINEFWKNAVAGTSGAALITKFDTSNFKTKFACELKEFDAKEHLDRSDIKCTDLFSQYALVTTCEALRDSGLDLASIDPYDIGVIWGSGQGGMDYYEKEAKVYAQTGIPRFSPMLGPKTLINMASGMISLKYGLKGMSFTTSSACATSNTAIMDAYSYIKLGKAKVFVTGGSEAGIIEMGIGGFNSMRALSVNNEHSELASRPFDVNRDGFVMGEGAGTLILEDYEHAKKRGAKIYAEIVGAAMTSDAYHVAASHPDGEGAAKSMELALYEAGIKPDEVDYLNAHATSTPIGDISEINAVRRLFGENPQNLKIGASKSMTGHLLGAAGAVESILCIKAIENGIIPPTINTTVIDPLIPDTINIVTGESIHAKVDVAITNSFGFGGHNATLVFKKWVE
ncbi:3-oxoacyl-[acyl-carrier-protein] synthase II [Draconibacterium orientale]|uniref:3-oxoacyl-[acyl-carrier-protein] synthase 2 n=2 Tax=Draconibacterium orientale TaxID=1168034 RepID=A0A1I0JZT0_9BACT|nr:beta-ketoacyl-ACP synthase II [Draconibacterium orientale]SEU16659.1 3-oxoacyl-[acyl-carrier-protein] synthase II [Draconibacterium orientale]